MRKLQLGLVLTAGLCIITLLALAFFVPLSFSGSSYSEQDDYLEDWTDETGRTVSLYQVFDKQASEHTFTRTIDGSTVNGRSLCLITHNLSFTVSLDDTVIYDYKPKLGGIYGKRYGEAVHTITIPGFTDKRTLKLEAASLRLDGTSGCNKAMLSDSRAFVQSIAGSDLLRLIACVITFWFGIVLFIIGLIEDKLKGQMLDAVCLGAITLIVSAWIGSQTMTLRFLSPNPAMLRVLEYITLDLLPIPTLLFVGMFTRSTKNRLLNAGAVLSVLNTIVSLALVICGVCDYSDLLIITHILIAGGIILSLFLIIRSIVSKEMSKKKSTYIISAVTILIASGLLDMIRYYLKPAENTSVMTVIGLFIFSLILAVYEFRRIVDMQVRSSEADLMHTLAMEDTLTGLGSRAAFVEHENSLKQRTKGTCLFAHFDVNDLKRANDVYGHAEGDRHLIAAADVLTESFVNSGKVYRVGGDEFFVILDGENCLKDYEKGIKTLLTAVERYNSEQAPPVPLSIAYGMAEYDCSTGSPETAERLADSRMYEKKRQMKEMSAALK